MLEHGFTGRQVQRSHMDLARRKEAWPSLPLPRERGALTALDVLSTPPGSARARAIRASCESLWQAFHGSHESVRALMQRYGVASRGRQGEPSPGAGNDNESASKAEPTTEPTRQIP